MLCCAALRCDFASSLSVCCFTLSQEAQHSYYCRSALRYISSSNPDQPQAALTPLRGPCLANSSNHHLKCGPGLDQTPTFSLTFTRNPNNQDLKRCPDPVRNFNYLPCPSPNSPPNHYPRPGPPPQPWTPPQPWARPPRVNPTLKVHTWPRLHPRLQSQCSPP